MKHHLVTFESEAAYRAYCQGDDKWLPRVSFIPTTPTPRNQITVNTPGRVVFSRQGEHFIEIANGGTMYFWDQIGTPKGDFTAEVLSDGTLDIHVPTDTVNKNGQPWSYIDPSTGTLQFWNYPEDEY